MSPELKIVLLVEDNPNDVEIIQHYLKKDFGELVYVVAEGTKDFYEKFTWVKPDLVMCDFDLPDGSGLEVLLEVKKEKDIPFIFVSGTLSNDTKLGDAILAGANGYVLKDNVKDLPDQVQKVMTAHHNSNQKENQKRALLNSAKLNAEKASELIQQGASSEQVLATLMEIKKDLNGID